MHSDCQFQRFNSKSSVKVTFNIQKLTLLISKIQKRHTNTNMYFWYLDSVHLKPKRRIANSEAVPRAFSWVGFVCTN